MRRYLLTLGLLATAMCLMNVPALGQKHDRHSFLGKVPPEIVSERDHWIGAREPLTLAKLKGRVVWLHFNF